MVDIAELLNGLRIEYMKIVIANGNEQAGWIGALSSTGKGDNNIFIAIKNADKFPLYPDAEAFIDLDFNGNFYSPVDRPLLINETVKTINQLVDAPAQLARFCAWPGFCDRGVWEMATTGIDNNWLGPVMHAIGKQYEIVGDEPGLVAPRILSMIINEALNAVAEGISSTEEIDMAMKMGTNYPDGPLAWANKIGFININELLTSLAKTNARYSPHPLLKITNP